MEPGGAGCRQTEKHAMNDTTMTETLVRHAMGGLKDSQGVPMADHCMRVANHFEEGTDGWFIGWLHDIIEDTHVDADYLRQFYDEYIVEAVLLLTHDKKEMDYPSYIDRICKSGNPTVIQVKLADQIDNNDPHRWLGMNRYKQNALRKKWAGVPDKLREALTEILE